MLRPSLSRPLQAKSDTDDVCRIRTLSVDIDSHVNPGEAFTVDPSHRTRQLIGSSHHPVRVIPWNGEPAMSTRLPAVVLVTVGAVVLSALAPMASAASDPSVRSRAQPRPRVVEAAATAVPMHQVGGAMNCAASAGSLLWLCSGRQLLAVDVLDPSQPRVVGRSALLPGILRALTLVEEGSKAWLVAGDFLVGLDLAKPAQPVELGRIDVQQDMAGALKPVMAVGDDGLLLGSWARGIVRLVLIADPRRPMVVASDDIRIPYGTRVLDLAARGDRLYVLEVTEESSAGLVTLQRATVTSRSMPWIQPRRRWPCTHGACLAKSTPPRDIWLGTETCSGPRPTGAGSGVGGWQAVLSSRSSPGRSPAAGFQQALRYTNGERTPAAVPGWAESREPRSSI